MKIPIGIIGLSERGNSLLNRVLEMDDIDLKIVCDRNSDRLKVQIDKCAEAGKPVDGTLNAAEVIERKDIEAVLICTSWNDHVSLAVSAMKHGLYTGLEVGPVQTIEQCFELVKAYEETSVPCMVLENCCYGQNELTVLNMIKNGLFGELIHCSGGYQHDLRILANQYDEDKERTYHTLYRNCDLYPTHELGPMMTYLNINRGNRMISLTSTASKSRGLSKYIKDNLPSDHPLAGAEFRLGDIITTVIKCSNGETMTLSHSTTLPRPYSRGGQVIGTNGIWMEDKDAAYIEGMCEHDKWKPFSEFVEKYEHPLWKAYRVQGVKEGHGGMDFLMLRAFFESVRNKTQTPIDIYDGVSMIAVSVLSEQSIALGSAPVAIPDFTNGTWINRDPYPASIYSLDKVHTELFENITNL